MTNKHSVPIEKRPRRLAAIQKWAKMYGEVFKDGREFTGNLITLQNKYGMGSISLQTALDMGILIRVQRGSISINPIYIIPQPITAAVVNDIYSTWRDLYQSGFTLHPQFNPLPNRAGMIKGPSRRRTVSHPPKSRTRKVDRGGLQREFVLHS